MNDACSRGRTDVAFGVARILAVIVAVLVLGAVPAHSFDVSALAIDPLSPTVVYAGSYGGGVLKSADGGQNWSLVA